MSNSSSRSEAQAAQRKGPTLRRNLLFNAVGVLLPLAAALISIPLLLGNFGLERFGIFMLLMAALAYAGLLDCGLGAAITFRIPRMLAGSEPNQAIVDVASAALTAALVSGVALCAVCFVGAAWIPNLMTDPSAPLAREIVSSVRVLALAIPPTFGASVLAGVLSAHGEFVMVNKVRIPAGVAGYLVPALGCVLDPNLAIAALLLVLVRYAIFAAHLVQCKRLLPGVSVRAMDRRAAGALRPLLAFGGWATVSSVIGPFMVYLDRFYLAALRSAQDVASYVTPYEVATKLALLPGAVLPVLFPIFVAEWARRSVRSQELPLAVAGAIGLLCAFPAAILATIAPQLLDVWLARQLPAESAAVLQVLAGALVVNCVAQVFLIQLQSRGHTRVIAGIHLSELLGYGVLLLALTAAWGVVGVALAWAIRVTVDAALMCHYASKPLTHVNRRRSWCILLAAIAFGGALASLALVSSALVRLCVVLVPLATACLLRRQLFALLESVGMATIRSKEAAST